MCCSLFLIHQEIWAICTLRDGPCGVGLWSGAGEMIFLLLFPGREHLWPPGSFLVAALLTGLQFPGLDLVSHSLLPLSPASGRGWQPCTVSVSWLLRGSGSILAALCRRVHCFMCFFPCLRGSGTRGPGGREETCPGAGSVHSTTMLRDLVLSSPSALLCPPSPRGILPLCGSMAFRCLQMPTLIFNPCLCFHLNTRIFAPLTSQIHTE